MKIKNKIRKYTQSQVGFLGSYEIEENKNFN